MTFTSSSIGRYAGFWLIVTAVIELALAGLFVFLGLALPVVDFGMFLTAGILGAVGLACLVIGLRVRSGAAANAALLENGIAGQALVTGLTQTGMYLNNNPQVGLDLLVQLPDRPAYAAKRKEFIPLIMLGRLNTTQPLPVKVDPADPQRLVIDWQNAGQGFAATGFAPAPAAAAGMAAAPAQAMGVSALSTSASAIDESLNQVQAALQSSGAAVAAPFASADQGTHTTEQLRAWLRENGVAATARIDQVMDMGQVVGDEKLFTMQVTLELPGEAPKQLAPSGALVPLAAASKVKVGWRVPVRVAAENHQLLMFEWEKV